MVTLPSMLQAPIQAMLRPAMWIPGIKKLHSHEVTWESDKSQAEVLKALVTAIKQIQTTDDTGAFYDIHKIDENQFFLRIFCFTKAEWLDVVEIKIQENNIEAKSFSSGFLPLFFPFVFILNIIFFWVPFYDNKFNRNRLELIKHYTDLAITSQGQISQVQGHPGDVQSTHSDDVNSEAGPREDTQIPNVIVNAEVSQSDEDHALQRTSDNDETISTIINESKTDDDNNGSTDVQNDVDTQNTLNSKSEVQ